MRKAFTQRFYNQRPESQAHCFLICALFNPGHQPHSPVKVCALYGLLIWRGHWRVGSAGSLTVQPQTAWRQGFSRLGTLVWIV